MSIFMKLALATAVAWCLLLGALYFGQRRLIYLPDRQRVPPAVAGLVNVDEVVLRTADGASLISWWGKAKPGQPTILYFHGNGAGLADRAPRIERFMAEGWGVFIMSYRGYSGSTGSPTEGDNLADAKRAYDNLSASGVASRDIVIYGESLGTSVAAHTALERPAAGLILDAPFTSVADVAAGRFSMFPVRRYIIDRYDTAAIIGRLRMPLLVLHDTLDQVVPVAMGREIWRLANEPKQIVEFPRGGHTDLYLGGNDALRHVRAWIAGLR